MYYTGQCIGAEQYRFLKESSYLTKIVCMFDTCFPSRFKEGAGSDFLYFMISRLTNTVFIGCPNFSDKIEETASLIRLSLVRGLSLYTFYLETAICCFSIVTKTLNKQYT